MQTVASVGVADNKQQMYQWIDSLPRRQIIFDVSSEGPSSGIGGGGRGGHVCF